jgi:uridylate kinase
LSAEDPKIDPTAKKIDNISYAEVLSKNLTVADISAIALAKENRLPIKVIAINEIFSILDDSIGSLIGVGVDK